MYSVAHLSDLHATPVRLERPADVVSKRVLGWLSWRVRRRRAHRPEVLDALARDLGEVRPDQVVVTGDLTNVAGTHEFPGARDWLERLGGPGHVSVVPGNHDAYVAVPRETSWDLWTPYLRSDAAEGPAAFPTLRVRGPVAIVGACSALPTRPFLATGRLGAAQLERLEKLLAGLSDSTLCRILLVHHPPAEGAVSPRRALTDAAQLRGVLARTGADLVLHGHGHRTRFGQLPGPEAPIPVVGVPSSSDVGRRPEKRARYHLYDIEPVSAGSGARFRIRVRIRGYDPSTGRFAAEGERGL